MTKKRILVVPCTNTKCKKPFHYAPVEQEKTKNQGEEKSTGDVVVSCPYCSESVVITLERPEIEREYLTRGSE